MRKKTWMAALALLAGGCGDDPEPTAKVKASPAAAGHVKIKVGRGPGYATFAFGKVWVGNHGGDTVVGIDPATNEVVSTVDVPGEPTGISSGFGSLWTFTPLNGGKIHRIDPEAGEVEAVIEVDTAGAGLGGPAQAAGAMWIADEDRWLRRIDPKRNTVKKVLRLPKADVPCPGQLTAAGKDLWMAWECGNDRILRIDPRRGRIAATIKVPDDFATWTATDGKRVWAVTQGGKVLELERDGIAREAQVADTGSGLVHGEGALWVRAGASKLVRVDAATLEPTRTDTLADAPVPGGGVATGAGAVWAANFGEGTVYRLRP